MNNKTCQSSNKLLREVEDLRKKLSEAGSPLTNNEIWSIQQALQVTCGNLLISFQEIALEKGIERDLWNFGFRTTITQLQSQTKDKKKASSEAKDVLTWFLSSASGFYLQLLNQICSVNSLDLVFRRKDSIYGLVGGGLSSIIGVKTKENVTKNALYLCQYCLIHLGDLARYRHQAKQAETYYRHAVTVAATSGHPYNQLALLEAGRGNRLNSVFLYIRALCVPAPFPGAPSNLIQTLNKVLSLRSKDDCKSEVCEIKVGNLTRMTKEEYINLFLHFHSSLFLKGDLESAKDDLPRLASALSMLVATTTLTRSSLVQIFTVSVFAVHYFSGQFSLRVNEENTSKKDEEKLIEPKECEGALDTLEDLIVAILAALFLPIHTMKESEVVLAYPALPAILLMLEWIFAEKKLSSQALKKKQQIWPGLCTLVNFLEQPLKNFDAEQFIDMPLPENWDLQEFRPLHKILGRYKYRESTPRLNPEQYNLLRAKRITELATKISEEKVDGSPLIKKSTTEDGCVHFDPMSAHAAPVEEVLDLERLTLQPNNEQPATTGESSKKDKKVGILKPQGSLERSKAPGIKDHISPKASLALKDCDKKAVISPHAVTTGEKRGLIVPGVDAPPVSTIVGKPKPMRTNVALQAILKRNSNTQESKQVTFRTPSPAPSPNPSDASSESQRSQATPPLGAVGMQLAPPNLPVSPLVNQNSIQSFPPFQQQRFPPTFRPGSGPRAGTGPRAMSGPGPLSMPPTATTLAQSYSPGVARPPQNFPLRENQGQQPPFFGLRGAPLNKGAPFGGNENNGNLYSSQPLFNRGPYDASSHGPMGTAYELANRRSQFELNRGPSFESTNQGPLFEPSNRRPPFESSQGPLFEPTSRRPIYDSTNQGPPYESTNRGAPYESTTLRTGYEKMNRAPDPRSVYDSMNRGPFESTSRGSAFEPMRGPSFELTQGNTQSPLYSNHSQPMVNWKISSDPPPETGVQPTPHETGVKGTPLQVAHPSSLGNLFPLTRSMGDNPAPYKDIQGFNLPFQQTMPPRPTMTAQQVMTPQPAMPPPPTMTSQQVMTPQQAMPPRQATAPTSPKETPSISLFMDRGLSRGVSNPAINQGTNLMDLASGQRGGNSLRSSATKVFPEEGSPGVTAPWWGKDGRSTRPGNQYQSNTVGSHSIFGQDGGSPPSFDTSMPPPNISSSQFQPQGGFGLTGVSPPYSMEGSNSLEGSMRMTNTYSLFGPLGGGRDALQQPFQQSSRLLNQPTKQQNQQPQPQQLPAQSLWSAPSPLQKLLEQKKYSSK